MRGGGIILGFEGSGVPCLFFFLHFLPTLCLSRDWGTVTPSPNLAQASIYKLYFTVYLVPWEPSFKHNKYFSPRIAIGVYTLGHFIYYYMYVFFFVFVSYIIKYNIGTHIRRILQVNDIRMVL